MMTFKGVSGASNYCSNCGRNWVGIHQCAPELRSEVEQLQADNARLRAELDGAHAVQTGLANDVRALSADLAEANVNYEEGLEAWRKNNEFFGGWCERLAGVCERLVEQIDAESPQWDLYTDEMVERRREVVSALAQYEAARGARG